MNEDCLRDLIPRVTAERIRAAQSAPMDSEQLSELFLLRRRLAVIKSLVHSSNLHMDGTRSWRIAGAIFSDHRHRSHTWEECLDRVATELFGAHRDSCSP
jgi:hypothetical protein